ncbi:hypothetical protein Tco_0876553 [Tanacetum coccineum]|uniref:Uncharacterized protein n=1 Tax=Tanacetum coccineum TaxID=301880 RepID=A0ABQ5BVL3_9ASTR
MHLNQPLNFSKIRVYGINKLLTLFGDSFIEPSTFQLSQHLNNLETLLNTETLHEMDSKSALRVIKVQFERFNSAKGQEVKSSVTSSLAGDETSSRTVINEEIETEEMKPLTVFMGKDQEIPYDTSDPANRFCPDGKTQTLEKESRSKLDKDKKCGKCVFNSNHDACVSRYLKDVNARTKKPRIVPISASKPKRKANKSVATPHKKTVATRYTILI